MSSLNRRHQASELLRAAAKMRLEREAAARMQEQRPGAPVNSVDVTLAAPAATDTVIVAPRTTFNGEKPTLHLFNGG